MDFEIVTSLIFTSGTAPPPVLNWMPSSGRSPAELMVKALVDDVFTHAELKVLLVTAPLVEQLGESV
ncbi:hypothetical protein OG698_47300 [Streptomyces sp. NBC_01003]|uniref:hypothetical protein n=1 Tax=Streptomyces sp. NBC_01003 TaxID=2903714 RepID=UPI0038630AD6|nr:hypothetical protein OG698_47300 [Streptomyces sp. NBC_01003]